MLDTEIAALEADIRAAVRACRETAARAARIETLPGIGPATCAVLISDLPELRRLRAGQIAALGGLAPHTRQSGAWRGRSFISGGRKPVRGALYTAATSTALRGSSRFARHYKSLRARGKPH
ncbi:MAG: IS110 family transposase [Rhodobacteraceae bacterium]|nr:IS110 family transposase [Paracoccaceae bacterium]